jgi:nitroimidazol reductase NimA-like FMN-containing flavoprotein (pyridoxamine 5'-phosphate oxidase superfamily)
MDPHDHDHDDDDDQRGEKGGETGALSREDCLTMLGRHAVGRLVYVDDGPVIRPVNYTTDGERLFCRLDRPFLEPEHVLFEVDCLDESRHHGWSVIVEGHASSVLADSTDAAEADRVGSPSPWAGGPKPWMTSISIVGVTGRWVRGAHATWHTDQRGYV